MAPQTASPRPREVHRNGGGCVRFKKSTFLWETANKNYYLLGVIKRVLSLFRLQISCFFSSLKLTDRDLNFCKCVLLRSKEPKARIFARTFWAPVVRGEKTSLPSPTVHFLYHCRLVIWKPAEQRKLIMIIDGTDPACRICKSVPGNRWPYSSISWQGALSWPKLNTNVVIWALGLRPKEWAGYYVVLWRETAIMMMRRMNK